MKPSPAAAAGAPFSPQLFGVAHRLGPLEKGKSATLFVPDGDPFETKNIAKENEKLSLSQAFEKLVSLIFRNRI